MNGLEIRNLCKSYPGYSLENLSLTLPEGCIMGLVGENGAGKTTTIKLILDMVTRDSGDIFIFGKNNQENIKLLKEDIGVVLDEVGFPECLTAKQIGKIMKNTYRSWDEVLYRNYLKDFSIPADKTFKEFSRGMKMKCGIAAAMSHNPRLLILDEATSGLDPVARDEFIDMIAEFTRDESHSVLISSHIVSDLEKICDYIAFLHKGRLLLCEEKDILLEKYGVAYCTFEELQGLEPTAVKGKKQTPYGVEVLVNRDLIPASMNVSPIDVEQLFVFMAKEAK